MRTRVASIVTLLTLILLGTLLAEGCAVLADEKNGDTRRNLDLACWAMSAKLEGETAEERAADLSEMDLEDRGMVAGLYKANGSADYVTDGSALPLSEEDIAGVRPERVNVYSRRNSGGRRAYYAIYRFDDGAFLLFTREHLTGISVLFGNGLLSAFGVLIILLLFYLLAMLFSSARREEMARRVMSALDDFADGKFDARVKAISGREEDAEVYNAVIGRIADRVHRQTSQNNAINMALNQMQNGIIAVDDNLKVILVTPVAKKLLGIIGSPEGKLISDASRDVHLDDVFNEAMRQAGVYTNEVAVRNDMGRGHRPLRFYVSPMRNDGRVVGALAMVEDITEIRRLEQVRTDFAANVSHELKTPLTSIRGFVETLENGAIDNPEMAHKFLRIIMLETERLTRLINDILSISKLESGEDDVVIERLQLDKMAFDVADMLAIHATEKDVSIECHLNRTPVYIMGNADRVEQMLINLIENAIKYNKPGGSVTVQVFSNGVDASVAISDTGIGIAPENLPRLFERFYRVDKGRSRQMGGTGLGLAIVKHIVRSMNGQIEVHSTLDEGTEFLITLPLPPEKNPEVDTIFDNEAIMDNDRA